MAIICEKRVNRLRRLLGGSGRRPRPPQAAGRSQPQRDLLPKRWQFSTVRQITRMLGVVDSVRFLSPDLALVNGAKVQVGSVTRYECASC